MANVFVSHRGSDAVPAEHLAVEIRAAGHRVWLDNWEINVGDQIVAAMNAGLEGATYLVVCYSAQGMAAWMNIEWQSALARQLNGHNVKILPVKLTGDDVPAILAGTKYADVKKDWNRGVDELLKAIR